MPNRRNCSIVLRSTKVISTRWIKTFMTMPSLQPCLMTTSIMSVGTIPSTMTSNSTIIQVCSQLKKTPVISIFNIVFLYRSCRSESKTYGYKYHCRLQHEATSEVKSRITSYSTLCFYRNVHFTKRLHILILLFLQRCISYDTAFTMQVSPKETLHKSLLFWVANPRV